MIQTKCFNELLNGQLANERCIPRWRSEQKRSFQKGPRFQRTVRAKSYDVGTGLTRLVVSSYGIDALLLQLGHDGSGHSAPHALSAVTLEGSGHSAHSITAVHDGSSVTV